MLIKIIVALITISFFLGGCSMNKAVNNIEVDTESVREDTTIHPSPQPSDFEPAATAVIENEQEIPAILNIDDIILSETIDELCITPRKYGTDDEERAAAYITALLGSYGYTVERQKFPVFKKDTQDADALGFGVNLIASISPEKQYAKTLIISAHYDTISNYVGAIDNASGVSVLLEIARTLKNYEFPFTVKYIFFSAEEAHLSGSDYFAKQLSSDEAAAIIGNINIDMVAEKDGGDFVFITPNASPNILTYIYNELISPEAPIAGTLWGESDSASFIKNGIPGFTLSQSSPDFSIQQLKNDIDKIDTTLLRKATKIVVDLICGLDLRKYEEILAILPNRDFELADLDALGITYNDHNIKNGAIDGFSLVRSYNKLMLGGVYSEFNYVFSNQEGAEYVIRQIPSGAATILETSGYTEKKGNGGYFDIYYIQSYDKKTTLHIGKNLSFQTTIEGSISEEEAEAVLFNILRK